MRNPEILVVAAMREEIAGFITACPPCSVDGEVISNHYWEPPELGGSTGFFCCGVGRKRAAKNLTRILKRVHPRSILIAGFSGALNPGCGIGDVFVMFGAYSGEKGPDQVILLDEAFNRRIMSDLSAAGVDFSIGNAVTVDRMVNTATDRQNLQSVFGADCVDMESYPIAGMSREREIPVAMVRVITDFADESLGLDLNRIPAGKWRFRIHFILHPLQLPALLRLYRNLRLASRKLSLILHQILG